MTKTLTISEGKAEFSDQNFRLEHLKIRILNLFRISYFEFRILLL